jgi:hypothetical protein
MHPGRLPLLRLVLAWAILALAGAAGVAEAQPATNATERPAVPGTNPPAVERPAPGNKVFPPREAGKHIGETATIRGKVAEVFVSPKGTVFVNFDRAFPDTEFYAVCFGEAIPMDDLKKLLGKTISVTGPIREYFGRAQIILRSRDQVSE